MFEKSTSLGQGQGFYAIGFEEQKGRFDASAKSYASYSCRTCWGRGAGTSTLLMFYPRYLFQKSWKIRSSPNSFVVNF